MSHIMANLNVMDMANAYADAQQVDVDDLFKKEEPVKAPEAKTSNSDEDDIKPVLSYGPKKGPKQPWVPDQELLEGLDELHQETGAVYNSDEVKLEEDTKLDNIIEDDAKQEAMETMDELHRKEFNITECKKRRGYDHLQIPNGPYEAAIMAAAGDDNYQRAQQSLDNLFDEIERDHPDFISTWLPGFGPKAENVPPTPSLKVETNEDTTEETTQVESEVTPVPSENTDEMKIIVDKRDADKIAWTADEIEKIKRSRTIELNIIEGAKLEFGEIEDADSNTIDNVLSQYVRKTNDVSAVLPASRYRCTFTGLSYPEVLDLSNSDDIDNVDGEIKKWSICFEHMKNPSIGPWEEYRYYTDPETGKEVHLENGAPIPPDIDASIIKRHSKFDDFLMKTSFLDLDFMLWKVLCATTMETETIAVDCRSMKPDGTQCNNSYSWIYYPASLLQEKSINPEVLNEMEKTGTANTREEIMSHYNDSMLRKMNTVKLHRSGFYIVFGHVSAYDYINTLYGKIKELQEAAEADPTALSKSLNLSTLIAVKEILVPNPATGKLIRIKNADKITEILKNLDEIDWQTVMNLVDMAVKPYQFTYAITGLICPKCKSKSSITIRSMSQLLFIVAQSLGSVTVKFTQG